MSDDTRNEARERFESGDFARARRLSMTALEFNADDLELLRLAGKSGVELATDDAVTLLSRAVELEPGNARCWRDLGEALAAEGRAHSAADAFRNAVEIQPNDAAALADLGHSAHAAGRDAEAVDALARAVELNPSDRASMQSLLALHRHAGRLQEARETARRLADGDPDDALALIEVAELELELDQPDDALAAFARLREIDDVPEHEVYALHGMLWAEMRRENWSRAVELARDAVQADPSARTEAVLGFFAAQAGEPQTGLVAERTEVDAMLRDSHAEHRRAHSEELGF